MENPFILEPYKSKDLFCDRETETRTIISYLENGRNITLVSPRRLGKTGLIYRVFEQMKDNLSDFDTFYMDISSSVCLDDFIKLLSESVVTVLNSQTRIANFFRAVGGIRPVLSYNEMSGKPEVSWTYRNDNEKNLTLKGILSYLEKHQRKVVVAIDEFQQIREYITQRLSVKGVIPCPIYYLIHLFPVYIFPAIREFADNKAGINIRIQFAKRLKCGTFIERFFCI